MERLLFPPRDQIFALVFLGALYLGAASLWPQFWTLYPDAKIDLVAPLMGVCAVAIGFGIWLAWRSANKDPGSGGAYFTKLTCLAIFLAGTTLLINQWAQASLAPPAEPARQPQLTVQGNVALLDGPIDFTSYEALKNTLAASPNLTAITLESPGGRIPAARGLARLVREARLDTHVEQLCASACTLVFIAGQKRSLSPGAQLGFHGYRLISTVATLDIAKEEARDHAFYVQNGVSQSFAARAFETPHDEMWLPERRILTQAGVLRP